jgi:adenylate cyclase
MAHAATFVFADIAGFTAMTEAHGDEEAVALVEAFTEVATRDLEAVQGEHGAPVRVGLHHGPAVERNGDYFGAAVNLAARVSGVAAGGKVLVSGPTAAMVPDLDGVAHQSRGRHELRNVSEPLELFAGLRLDTTAEGLPIDPVCRMAVDPERAPRPAGCCIGGTPTSSARSRAPVSSRNTPSATPER